MSSSKSQGFHNILPLWKMFVEEGIHYVCLTFVVCLWRIMSQNKSEYPLSLRMYGCIMSWYPYSPKLNKPPYVAFKCKLDNHRMWVSQPHFGQVWGWNSHSQSWGFGVLRDSRMFRVQQQGPKHLALGCFWCHWKGLEVYMSKMASYWPFGHLQPKLGVKEGPGVKLAVWLPTTKSRESTCFHVRSESATWRWKALFKGYKFGSYLVPIGGRGEELRSPKVLRVQIGTISGLHFGSPEKKSHSDATPVGERRVYYREYGGGISRARSVVCHVNPS
jgi:hypothetical protein